MPIASVDPATGETVATFAPHTTDEVERRLALAAQSAPKWAARPLEARVAMLREAAAILERDGETYGRLMSREMGKPLRAAVEEAAKCALGCRYYAERAGEFLAPETVSLEPQGGGEVRFLPIGIILAVMPWNFPFWQVVRFAAPALVAGNVGLLKHASNVPQCALALEELFARAGAPEGVFQTLLVGSDRVAAVIADARVRAVTLTGSEPAGREVAAAAGRHLKKTVLELGGSDPFIVSSTADVARAAEVAVRARIVNNGQSCIAAKRFIVVGSVADEFEKRFVSHMEQLRVGFPLDPATDIGPLATAQIAGDLHDQVQRTVQAGARLLLGGTRPAGHGNFYPPTVLADVPRGSPGAVEELFGPVACLFRVRDVSEAIALANDSSFGLGASAWTNDSAEAERFANEIETGQVFINGMVASDPRYPFGGVKNSGYGRELGPWGLREFVNVKTVRYWRAAESPSRAARKSPPTE